ncbi:MAG: UDP-N-acetylmuramoyl-tripeptide--D-alanyl-D-alanine ligase, partial [Anaerovoracaceae bacterium]
HDYIANAIKLGCKGVVLDNKDKLKGIDLEQCNIILVEDSTLALQQLASYYLTKMNIKVIGVTGSTGKTSTRDMIYAICKQKFKTKKNRGNFNTVVGVPLTVLEMDEDTEVAVLEMGMDRFGEIDTLAKLTNPSIGVITNIGVSHLEHLGSRDGIFKAKMEIVNYFNKDSALIVTESEDYLNRHNIKGEYKLVVSGDCANNNIRISDIKETSDNSLNYKVHANGETVEINLPVPGRHNAFNSGLAIAAAMELGITLEECAKGLEQLEITGKRLAIKKLNGIKIIDDTYNASPDSMKSALDTLKNTEGKRKIAILGDMFELGADEVKFHQEVGQFALNKADVIFTIGNLAKNISEKNHYDTKEEFINDNKDFFVEGDVVLVKASRGMALEEIINKLFRED